MDAKSRKLALSLVCAACTAARAQDDNRPGFEPAPARLSLRVDAMLWYMGPGGDVDLPGGVSDDAPEIDIDLLGYDTPRWVPMPEAHIEWDMWRVCFRGYAFSGDRNSTQGISGEVGNVAFGPTTQLRASLDYSSFEAEVAREVYDFPVEVRDQPHPDFLGRVELIGGVRMIDVDWRVSRSGDAGPPLPGADSTSADEIFIQPIVGARLEMLFGEEFGIDWQVNLGGMMTGDTSSASLDVLVGGWWRCHPNVALQIGYRAAFFSLSAGEDADEFAFSGSNQGVQVGLMFTF